MTNFMKFEPTLESVSKHEVPTWYHDAKFGIFIHWSLSSVPAYAPVDKDLAALLKEEGELAMYSHTPYAEWYQNSLLLEGSPVQQHHLKTYGKDYPYDNFAEEFNKSIEAWKPDEWVDLFEEIQAQYVVLVAKHHDGFTLFQSDTPHPTKRKWQASRDIVKELTEKVKARGIKMGLYYSGSLDWTFANEPISDFRSLALNGSTDPVYVDYVDKHFRELVDKYQPSVLWNDIGYPPRTNVFDLFAHYYNTVPEGVINDRWIQIPARGRWIFRLSLVKKFISWLIRRAKPSSEGIEPPRPPHSDYSTPEYTVKEHISKRKWECVRGIGKSFGYNAEEKESDFLTGDELIHMLIDIVSKNGNLLLNIGPKKDGSIPDVQIDRLKSLGRWLGVNGNGIFETRPWLIATTKTECGLDIRFTAKENLLYIFILGQPKTDLIKFSLDDTYRKIILEQEAELLGGEATTVQVIGEQISLTANWLNSSAQCLKLKV